MKRFTETTKWTANPWFRKLPPRLKCLWLFFTDCCDAAGVIEPDWELVSFQIGEAVSETDLANFSGRIEQLPNGKLFLSKFIAFQHGKLSPDCKPHIPIYKSLHSNGIEIERVSEGYPKGLRTLEDKEKEKSKEQDSLEEGCGEKPDLVGIVNAYPRRQDVALALEFLTASIRKGAEPETVMAGTRAIAAVIQQLPSGANNAYVPSASTFFKNERWRDDPQTWRRNATAKNGAQMGKLDLGGRCAGEVIRVRS